ncbi:DUF748 domain-containing protein [Trinickia caryophylli]|uniref:Uncharacterized protein involved in outer membrane biogenesis n=1 Tax=Trinickia caryophylli TaxID=28094 RepID=A0A1X7FPN2_TRICW|nr:DUF748 domain-containing protein [Trinickia caryophylli]PMS09523.1 DUF748 domain-containing protein [Trinickia caryophylli]TRX14438.1 DUF748 domain-containing protein [Trinickia caryophylli]WQE14276.1 DUF748 domain-containing protein [Trinickia caryophylli]SMF56344.1 Uncharacterized protein involved in outer membrane biogenesis [Trinickia caryophylli]GLU33213.1 hypothetical protein Busp01_30550 [Trinickia caryophylli]
MPSESTADKTKAWVKLRGVVRGVFRGMFVSRRTRRIAISVVAFVALLGVAGFFAAPPLIRHVAETQLTSALGRPTAIERVKLNPYTLRLEADGIRIDDKDGGAPLLSAQRLIVRVSWVSLLRFAPIVEELRLDAPRANVVRYDAQRFNFTDIVEKFSAPSGKPETRPMLFSVSNIAVENGRIDFDDRLLGQRHVVDQLSLGVPFIATLPSKTDIFVDPRFAARVDGSPISVGGKTKPFAASRESEVELKFDGLDLPKLLSYVPAKLPVAMESGKLAGNLKLRFAMSGAVPTLTVAGTADLAEARLVDAGHAPLFAAQAVHVAAATLQPFKNIYHFDEIRLEQPSLHLARERSGELSVARAFAPAAPAASSAAPASVPASAPAVAAPPTDVSIKHLALDDGKVELEDRAPAEPVRLALDDLNVALDGFSTLADTPARYTVRTALAQGGTLAATGSVGVVGKRADAKITADALPLALAQPYLEGITAARLSAGTLGGTVVLDANWSQAPAAVRVGESELALKSVKIAGAGPTAPAIALGDGRLAIKQIDLAARTADIASIEATGLAVKGTREKDGRIDLAAWAAPAGAKPAPARESEARRSENERKRQSAHQAAPTRAAASKDATAPGWRYSIGQVRLKDGSADILDQVPARPAKFRFTSVQLEAGGLSNDMGHALPVKLSATLNGKGTLETAGNVVPDPLDASLTLRANRLDVAAFEPYFGDSLNAVVASALANAGGNLKLSMVKGAVKASFRGGAALVDVRLLDRITSAPLAGWRSLALNRVNARYDERGTDLDIGRVTFAQFFGSVLLSAQGKLNLDDVLAREKGAEAPAVAEQHGKTTTAVVEHEEKPPTSHPLRARVGEVVLQQGRVNYTDNFVKPNYTANLVDITGTIGAFGTETRTPAPVNVGANLAGNGPIAIRGTVDPLAPKPSLDLTASAHDIELTNLTPYSLKYAGYPITKGKLNVELHYKLDNDLLSANNHLFIDQLTFGEHVENDTATKLPVRLAISLLKNRRGQIDVNIPVSGSLSSPEFSLGSLIWSAVLHLIERAVTAPFSLLANAFGGSGGVSGAEDLRYVAFSSGSAELTDSMRGKLDTIAKLLDEKPEVKLDLTGRADPAIDTPALRLAYVDELVKREKLKTLVGHGESVDESTVTVDKSEYSDLLAKAYKDADIKKPRNFIGLAKSLPDDDMRRMLAANAPVDEASLRRLAQQRADEVRQYLIGKVDASRVFVVAPKVDAKEVKDSGPTTRVDFGLH